MVMVRYADDTFLGFEHREEAERFLAELRGRVAQFGLSLHPEKTRLIAFGRHANAWCRRHGQRRAQTFDFLGFTHICGITRGQGLVPAPARDDGQADACQARGDQAAVASASSRTNA